MGVERVTFVIKAENQAHILLPVVALFHELNVGIDAIWMVRRRTPKSCISLLLSRRTGRAHVGSRDIWRRLPRAVREAREVRRHGLSPQRAEA